MDLVLINGAAYLFFVAAMAALFPLLTLGLEALVPDEMIELKQATMYVGAFLGTLTLVGAFPLFRQRLEGVLEDRAFGADRRGLSEHIRRISLIADPTQLYRETVDVVSHGLEVPQVAIYCRSEHAAHYQLRASVGFPKPWVDRGVLGEKDWVIRKAQSAGTVTVMYELDRDQEGDSWRDMEALRRESGIEVVVPIKADNIFFGVLVCGSRRNHRLYSDLAISLLETIGLQIGLTLRSRQIERQANQTEKLISLGTLAAGLAHELRNPLVSIRTFGALIEEQGGDPEFRREFRGVVERDVNRIGSIIDHVAAFAENSQVKVTPVQLAEVISGVHDIARPEFTRAHVKLEVERAEMPPVLANYGQMIQVFLNLFQNAIQAMEGRPDPRIDITFQQVSPERGKRAVRVTISDNGPGIDESVRARIFDPFVTTKATGETGKRRGMGLGLAIVKRIIDGHGGSIDVVSQPGRGTSFYVQLPCVEFSK
jgi:two-component system nitrogen regulation sensor histidine kinase GlnL